MKRLTKLLFLSLILCARVGSEQSQAATLTMEQAIALAIQNNLNSKLAKAGTEAARGRALEAASGLLPKIMGSIQQTRVFKANFESQGFPANNPFFSPIIGPFNSFDARLQLVQSLLDVNASWTLKAGRAGRRIAILQEGLAREQVATAAALAYLEDQRAQRAVSAAQADLALSDSLLKLARDQHEAGVSTGIDVARAETARAQENLRLIRAQLVVAQADIRLKRVVGLPLDKEVSLPDIPRAELSGLPAVEKAVAEANQSRYELRIAEESYRAARDDWRAAKAENLPSIKALADYGFNGTTPDNTARTGSIGGRLDLPILAGGAIHGHIIEESARQDEAQARLSDAQIQVEEDIRLSLQTLSAEIEETRTADQAVDLAQKELKMAKDRFSAGVGDNIQVLNAQTALARALDDQVDAFARYDTARVSLAAAIGRMQEFK
jgi:outer membrane protein